MFEALTHKGAKENQSSNFDKRVEDSKNVFSAKQNKFNTRPFDFSQIPLQTKLKINTPGDRYEQEADRIADRVVNMQKVDAIKEMGNSKIQRNSLLKDISNVNGLTQRKCAACEEEEEETLQRKASKAHPVAAPPSLKSQLNATKGRGNPMDETTNQFMSSRLGVDFSHVNIHADDKAAEMSQSVNALAFTLGNDIYFNKGAYQPQTSDGKRLLAHELVHTVQQGEIIKNTQIDKANNRSNVADFRLAHSGGNNMISRYDCSTLNYRNCRTGVYKCGYALSGTCGWVGPSRGGCTCVGARRRPAPDTSKVLEVLLILGLSLALVVTVIAALLDPEPATKLLLGGLTAVEAVALLLLLGYTNEEIRDMGLDPDIA